jgi:two-component system phosphate regulon response regulator PhoB
MAATILVVEDEPAIQELIAYNLKQAGHQPLRADNAEQALHLVANALPDLVLLDWMLPGLSGIEFARRLRADKRTRAIPIIMLTARTDEQDKLQGLETGADDYITMTWCNSAGSSSTRQAIALPATASRWTSDRPNSGCCTF